MAAFFPVHRSGGVYLGFAVLLALLLGLGGYPVLRHTRKTYVRNQRIAELAGQPVEANVGEFLQQARRFENQARIAHRRLEVAERLLLGYKSRRETALILKEVGDDAGALGLEKMDAALARLTRGMTVLRAQMSETRGTWREFHENGPELHFERLSELLEGTARMAGQQTALLMIYGQYSRATRRELNELRRLAPQVADPVPAPLQELPARMLEVSTATEGLMGALQKIAALGSGR